MQSDPHNRSMFLSGPQRALLATVLDSIVPLHAALPGAGELGVAAHVEGTAGLSPRTRRLLSDGLKATQVDSTRAHSAGFADLSHQDRVGVLRRIESEHPDFFELLVQQTYAGYYTNPRVLRAKGLSDQPPQPRGHALDAFDVSLVEPVRKRGKAFRDA